MGNTRNGSVILPNPEEPEASEGKKEAHYRNGSDQPLHTEEEIREWRMFVYKGLVDTDPEYVEQKLRERKRGLMYSLKYLDPALTGEEAKKIAGEMMWWAPRD